MKFTKKVMVAGCGKSGIAAVKLLLAKGAEILFYDGNEKVDKEQVFGQIGLEDAKDKVELVLGEFPKERMDELELAVISPGIPTDLPFVLALKDGGIKIWGEIELAYQFGKGDVVAITGTNGKTTTTALTGTIMEDYFSSVFVVGNIGNPYTLEVEKMVEDTVTVAEISSFQLETVDDFCPKVSAILNITPDHLNRHHTMENYIAAKKDITRNQTKNQICVLNYDDEELRNMADSIPATVLFFSRSEELEEGICLHGDVIVYKKDGVTTDIINRRELLIPGDHNVENAMAGIGMGISMGVPVESIRKSLKRFRAVEHRIEFVAEKDGVVYYNDSKATNTDAAIKGIEAMDRPTLLIGGGYDKGSTYGDWLKACKGKVKTLVLLGQTRELIAKEAREEGITNIIMVESLEEAVEVCAKEAVSGDAVLLSPACASWGMFDNFEQRGQMFKDMVNNL